MGLCPCPVSDMEETKRLLVENSHLPMSIILVGVGRGDMSKMDILDDDNRTMSWNGRRSERDIVQFVEMSKYLPDQCLDPFTFHSVMDAANAKYHLARVGTKTIEHRSCRLEFSKKVA